tara:strand:- start:102 stop:317 length:216 start_codon:yes stop_codon:yes gene_type:complete
MEERRPLLDVVVLFGTKLLFLMELDTKLFTVAFLLTLVALVLVLVVVLVLMRLDNNNCDSIIGVGGGVVSK